MKQNKLLLIDGNNLLHRAYNKFKNMATKGGVKSSIVFGFPYILKSLITLHKPTKVIVVFDGGKAKARKKLLPDYKKRDKREDFDYDDFIKQKKDLEKILSYLGIAYTSKRHEEADDIIWLYARNYKRKGYYVTIVSTDKDFNQLLSSRLSIYNPWKSDRITHKNVEKLYGYPPEQCVDYLILDGDKSDNIPGYPGVGPKTAIKFLKQFGSIRSFLIGKDSFGKMDKRKLEELFLINRKMIDIRYYCRKHLKLKDVPLIYDTGKKIKKKKLALIASDYGITTFSKPDFINTYKNLL